MKWIKQRHIRNSFFHQLDGEDCGIACLMSVMRYFKIPADYSTICELVRGREGGASMLDLKRSARESGFEAQAFQMSLPDLQKLNTPVILHTVNSKGLNHFIVFYRYNPVKKAFMVGDPAAGLVEMDTAALDKCWVSKCGLVLNPEKNFKPAVGTGKWHWLFSLIHYEKFLLILITFLGLLTAFMGLSLAIYLQVLTDKILPVSNYTYMTTGLSLLAALFIARALIVNYRHRIIIAMVRTFNSHLVRQFSRHLANLPAQYLRSKTTGDMVVRFNDTQNIQVAFSTAVTLILVDMVMLASVTGFLFTYSIPVAVSILVFIALTISLALYSAYGLKKHQRQLTADFCRTNNLLISTVNNLKQAVGTPDLEKNGFFDFIGSTERFSTTIRRLSLRFDFIGSAFFAGILIYSSFLVMDHTYSKGQFLAMVTLIAGIFPVVQRICTTGMILMDGVIALERVYTMVAASKRNNLPDHIAFNQPNISSKKPICHEKNHNPISTHHHPHISLSER
ncbi:MAG: cysteine peptidase family C39 domain-containing protein [Bacteroidota bacterium]